MEEEKSFSVKDRRIRHDGSAADAAEEPAPGPEPSSRAAPAEGAAPKAARDEAGGAVGEASGKPAGDVGGDPGFSLGHELPPIDFSAFVFSLARTALIHLGLENHPETGGPDANLEAARETIDVLGMIEEKTRGNLTPEEAELISKMLYTLRMSYVEVARAHGSG